MKGRRKKKGDGRSACVRACVRACVKSVRACVRACVCVCILRRGEETTWKTQTALSVLTANTEFNVCVCVCVCVVRACVRVCVYFKMR